jgi:hypothetical protein
LIATVSHFLVLKTDLEVLESGHNTDVIEDEADALWTQVRAASDLLASYALRMVARNHPDGTGGGWW